MMQKRTLYSLLLTSFILVFALSSAYSQTVTFGSQTLLRCTEGELDITIDPGSDISAFEVVFEIESTAGGAFLDTVNVVWLFAGLNNRILDFSGVDNVSPDTIRIAGMLDNGDTCLAAGQTVIARVDFTTNDVCDGTILLDAATSICQPCPGFGIVASTQFVDCVTTALIPAAVTPGTITIINDAPELQPIADDVLPWGGIHTAQMDADDDDLHSVPGGCETLSYFRVGPDPANLAVDPSTGAITWPTTGADVGNHVITVEVVDVCGASDTVQYEVCVTNIPPTIVCPTDTNNIVWGYTATGSVIGDDADFGPDPLEYTVVSFDGPGGPSAITIDPANGDWAWPTLEDNSYLGLFELCIAVNDGGNIDTTNGCAPENADTCCLLIYVIPTFRVTIEKTHNTLQGHHVNVLIYLDDMINPHNEMGGFDFLIDYDQTALTFLHAEPGQMLLDCGWEYFNYRQGASGNCGPSACPSGIVRIVGMAETNNGANHPSCFYSDPGELVNLTFLVTDDRTFECQYAPIKWIWYDCGDNTISSVTGDSLFISRYIYEFEGGASIDDPYYVYGYPTFFGAQHDCDTALDDGKPDPLRIIDFTNGGVDIICSDSIDARGDINLNEIANEIGDAVVFTNYFVHGLPAFNVNLEGQIAATDVNADGITLSVADLVYLVRVIIGDASPYPKTVTSVEASCVHSDGVLSVNEDIAMGAAFVQIAGNVTPELLADNMEMQYNYDGVNTRILVYSLDGYSFTGQILDVAGEIVELELATSEGNPVVSKINPNHFSLNQNYPNPFNPTTTISFDVKENADYSLTIYNVNGQMVEKFTGFAEAGTHSLVWNANQNASGIYLYKLEIGGFTNTKKMVLLK